MLSKLKNIECFNRHISYAGGVLSLNSRVSYLGHEHRVSQDYDWHGLKRGEREFILWQYTISGRGALDYEGQEYDLLPGEAMLVHIPHDHRYFLPPDSEYWDFIFLILRGSECLRICREVEKTNGPVVIHKDISKSLEYALEIFEEASLTQYDYYKLSGLSYQLCLSLLSETKSQKTEFRPEAIDKSVKFALEHFEEAIGVGDMAEAADLSRYHFSREFKKYMGTPPADFIHKLRLDKAVNLLQSDSMPVYDVARKSGFESTSYFCRAFAKEFGVPPSAYRSRNIQKFVQSK